MSDTHVSYCRCSHPVDYHERSIKSTQCTAVDCDCPRPVNEVWQMLVMAWMFIGGLVLGLAAFSACMGGPTS